MNVQQQKEKRNQSQEPQSSSGTIDDGKKTTEETTSTAVSSSQQGETPQKQEITKEEEKKIVDAVLKELTPFVEQLVAIEVQRVLSGETGHDGMGMIQFPFMFASGIMRGNVGDEIPTNASNAHLYGSYSLPPGELIAFF